MNMQPLLAYLWGHGAHSFMWPLTLGEQTSALCSLLLAPPSILLIPAAAPPLSLLCPGSQSMQRVDSLEKTLMVGGIGGQEEKGTTEDEMAGWHHRLNGHEFA